ncbi:MAG TPA: FAD-linked oxidase C-terminal domain-containing protein [Candidatus Eremiobacteraceae bacterium]|nr:FAD-linked oxidase C-terminal domain-containing protein [Candidatus Eremiobacteraceae bacterium]
MSLRDELLAAVGPVGLIDDPGGRSTFAYEAALPSHTPPPDFVVLPTTTSQVVDVVKAAARNGFPIVPRGSGTGLCGGSLTTRGGITISTTRMNRILHVDYADRRAVVQPGVINLDLSEITRPHGFFYAPDPSSQRISTIGGNVACNAGGPHCLAYGTTTDHVLGLTCVMPDGTVLTVTSTPDESGFDLAALITGSEGTLAIVTEIVVRLTPVPEAVRVALAAFDTIDAACRSVSAIVARGLAPTALEMMDHLAIVAVESAFRVGYPLDCGAVLLIEVDGLADGIDDRLAAVTTTCREHGASSVREAVTQVERDALWSGRKGAAAAFGRMAPNFYIQDAVVPRSRLPEALASVTEIAGHYRVKNANVFHAGDGNLHPNIMFDRRDTEEVKRVVEAGTAILHACVDLGGTVSGEHGIGLEKRDALDLIFSVDDLAAMAKVKGCFNPTLLFNPDKIFPSNRRCGELLELAADSVMRATESGAWI